MGTIRVLAIDPGYDRLGVAVLEFGSDKKERLLYSSCITTDRSAALSERIAHIGRLFVSLLSEYTPTHLAIESLFFNKNTKTAMGVAEVRGVIIFLAAKSGAVVREFGPQEIKVAVTGYGKSDKHAVYDMVKRLIPNTPSRALDDEYDAIAIGITCLAHERK